VIRAEVPDLVILNEVCEDDVVALERALADAVPSFAVVSAFQAARNGRTGEAYRCRNGQAYSIGVVSRWPSVPGASADRGIYPAQDGEDPEERGWLCLDVAATPVVAVCTTHLAYTKREVALVQFRYLFGTVIAGRRSRDGAASLVMGGDLNLGSGDSPDLDSCLPSDSAFVDDGGQQHVVATREFVVDSSGTIDLRGATDRPGPARHAHSAIGDHIRLCIRPMRSRARSRWLRMHPAARSASLAISASTNARCSSSASLPVRQP
jgi:hypothetical protein